MDVQSRVSMAAYVWLVACGMDMVLALHRVGTAFLYPQSQEYEFELSSDDHILNEASPLFQ